MLAVFRADGGTEIGGGHIARCASLAGALRHKGWRTALASRPGSLESAPFACTDFDERLSLNGHEIDDMKRCWPDGCDVLVLDHYGRGAALEGGLRHWAKYLVAIDDLADRAHDCDLLIDPMPCRRPADYAAYLPGRSRLLLGPHYALLRAQFGAERALARQRRYDRDRLRILIMFGATDYAAQSPMAAEALSLSDLPIELDIIVGSQAPTVERLRTIAARSKVPIEITVDATDIANRMALADLAIGGAGTTSWERCCLGLPAIVIVLAANQAATADELELRRASITAGHAGSVSGHQLVTQVGALLGDRARLRDMSLNAAAICDGLGVERVSAAICEGVAGHEL